MEEDDAEKAKAGFRNNSPPESENDPTEAVILEAESLKQKITRLRAVGQKRNAHAASAAAVASGIPIPHPRRDSSVSSSSSSASKKAEADTEPQICTVPSDVELFPTGNPMLPPKRQGESPVIHPPVERDSSENSAESSIPSSFGMVNQRPAEFGNAFFTVFTIVSQVLLICWILFVLVAPLLATSRARYQTVLSLGMGAIVYVLTFALMWVALLVLLYRGLLYQVLVIERRKKYGSEMRSQPLSKSAATSIAAKMSTRVLRVATYSDDFRTRKVFGSIRSSRRASDIAGRTTSGVMPPPHLMTAGDLAAHPLSAAVFTNTLHSPLKQQFQQPAANGLVTPKLVSDADLLYFYWAAQKMKMRKQCNSMGDNINFVVPHVTSVDGFAGHGGAAAPSVRRRCPKCYRAVIAAQTGAILCVYCGDISPLIRDEATRQNRRSVKMMSYPFDETVEMEKLAEHTAVPVPPSDSIARAKWKFCWPCSKPRHAVTSTPPPGSAMHPKRGPRRWWSTVRRWSQWPQDAALWLNDLPAFQASTLVRNFLWVILYVWGVVLLRRESPNDNWSNPQVEHWIFAVGEGTGLWLTSWDYLVLLLAAPDRWRFVLSPYAILDVVTMAPVKYAALLLSPSNADNWTTYFGCLRVLRLARIESTLQNVVPWTSPVKLKVVSLITGVAMLVLMFSCAIYVLEAPIQPGYDNLYSFIFFSVVTISTVGFGDFAPRKPLSKGIVMVAIVVALTYLPSQIQRLVIALNAPKTSLGKPPAIHEDYILVAGPIAPRQLGRFCRQLRRAIPGACSRMVLLTTRDITEYTTIVRSAFLRGGIRIYVLREVPQARITRPWYVYARAVFTVGDVQAWRNGDSGGAEGEDLEAAQLLDDQQTLLRFIGAQHLCWPDRPIVVQLSDGTTKHLVTEMGAYHVVCLQHLKMKLMGKSCAGCPGFVPLVMNLFHAPNADVLEEVQKATAEEAEDGQEDTIAAYHRGARHVLYRMEFPRCCYGIQFSVLAKVFAAQFDVLLIGVSCVTKEYWLNPIGYNVGDELEHFTDWPFAGIVIAPSLERVKAVASLTQLDVPPGYVKAEDSFLKKCGRDRKGLLRALKQTTAEGQRVTSSRIVTLQSVLQETARPSSPGAAELLPAAGVVPDIAVSPMGLKEVQDVIAAVKRVFSQPLLPLIVICGWPRGLPVFLSTVRLSLEVNVIILAPAFPPGLAVDSFLPYVEMCAWVRGSAIDVTDLLRAGVLQAQSIAVFSTSQVPWRGGGALQSDTQAILAREFIYALHNSDTLLEKRLEHLITSARTEQQRITPGSPSAHAPFNPKGLRRLSMSAFEDAQRQATGDLRQRNSSSDDESSSTLETGELPLVLLELRESTNIDYVRLTPSPVTFRWTAKTTECEEGAGGQEDENFVGNPEYASGKVLLEEMLHGIITFALPVSRFCMDCGIVDHFVEGAHIPLPMGCRPECPVWLEDVPLRHENATFGVVFTSLLRQKLKLSIGVYRKSPEGYRTPLDLLTGGGAGAAHVISFPSVLFRMKPGDKVYVINACPAAALGLLLSPPAGSDGS